MTFDEIRSAIEAIAHDPLLHQDKNVNQRMEAADFIGFHLVGAIESLLQTAGALGELMALRHRAEIVRAELEQFDVILLQQLRENIRGRKFRGAEFKELISHYFDINFACYNHAEEAGYDNLDIFINQLIHPVIMPEQTRELEPEMVFYQKTPARIIFELAEKANFTKEDIFIDLGSGMGQVAILVNLLTGVTAKGIEFEPAFCAYANECASTLNLPGVAFINADARLADYSEGTVFFMYTPFMGDMMKAVLELLRRESLHRKIRLITYGPCTTQVALQPWLDFAPPKDNRIYKPAFFSSF